MKPQSICIVDKHGHPLVEQAAVLPIYSLAKPLIASAIFAAGVPIEAPVAQWIDLKLCPRAADISVGQLLNHSSGLTDYGALPAYHKAVQSGAPPWSDEEFGERTLQQPLLFEPGQGWSYSNPGYWLLGQILQQHTGMSFAAAIAALVADPLELGSLQVAHGQFADDLPEYPAGWVWHGLLLADAQDMVRFMRSRLIKPLLGQLIKVPVVHPHWQDPHHGYGLMVDPGIRFGHNGDGPGYSAACFRSWETGLTGCVLTSASQEGMATTRLFEKMAELAQQL